MGKAKVSIKALADFKNFLDEIRQYNQELQFNISSLDDAGQKIQNEICDYENLQNECQRIESDLCEKLDALKMKKENLQTKISILEDKISSLKDEFSSLQAEVNSKSKNKFSADFSFVQQRLESAKIQLETAENQLEKTCLELEKTEQKIEKAQLLNNEIQEKQNEIRTNLTKLSEQNDMVARVQTDLQEINTELQNKLELAMESLNETRLCVSRYLDVRLNEKIGESSNAVALRRCLNLKYAGMKFDYANAKNEQGEALSLEQIQMLREKYSEVTFTKIDSYGNTYPDFSKYALFEYTAPPVTKESLLAGTCLIGDSQSGSVDFKKFRQSMLENGYSKMEITELLSKNTIHHVQDCQTLLLIPREMHVACRHNGGAEKIRLQIATIGG